MLQTAPMSTSTCTSKSTTTCPTSNSSTSTTALQMMIAAGQQTVTSAAASDNSIGEPNESNSSSSATKDVNDKIQIVTNYLQEALDLADEFEFQDTTPMSLQQEKLDENSPRLTAQTTTTACTGTTIPCSSLSASLEDDDQEVSENKSKTPLRSKSCDLSPPTTTRTARRSLRRSITTPLGTSTDTTPAVPSRRNRSKSSPSLHTKACPVKMPARRTNSADNLRELMARQVPDQLGVSGLKRQSPCNSVTKLCRQTTDTTSSSYSVDRSARMPKRSIDSEEEEQQQTTAANKVVVDTSLVAQHHATRKDEDDASSLSSPSADDLSSSSCSTIGSEELTELIDLSNWQNHYQSHSSSPTTRSSVASHQHPTKLSHHTTTTVTSRSSFSPQQQQQQYPYGCCAGSVCTYTTNGTGPRPWFCLCEEENDYDFAFCGMCGAARNWACAHCNFARNKNRASFCGGCGMRR